MRKKGKSTQNVSFLDEASVDSRSSNKNPSNIPLKMVKTQELDAQDFCTVQHSRVLFLW